MNDVNIVLDCLQDIIQEVRKGTEKYRYEMLTTLTSAVLKRKGELDKRSWKVMLTTLQEIYPEIKVERLAEIVDKHYGEE